MSRGWNWKSGDWWIKNDVKQLLEIWTEAKGAMRFITILISILAAGWTLVLWAKDHIRV